MKAKIKFIVLIIIALYFGYRAYRIYFYTPEISFEQLNFYYLNGQQKNLDKSNLQSAIIIFFQTWCAPCIAEMKLIQKHQKDFKFTNIYLISDEPSEKISALKKRLHLDSLNFLISEKPLPSIGIESFPTAYIIKNNQIIESHKGAFIDESNFEDELYHLKNMLK